MVVVIGAVIGGAGAFFSDTETSRGNNFTAGAIDLKVDNESYYNQNICTDVNPSPEVEDWQWQGNSPYPVSGTECTTSFGLSDLDDGLLFFNFTDMKPDDEGEDTISLHVNNNDAYLCLDMSLVTDDDISSNEPELDSGDDPEDLNDTWDGELGGLMKMVWWIDDGDNVLETGETLLSNGVQSILDFFGEDKTFSADLADSSTNVWTPNTPGPVTGGQTYYIAKAFCYGDMNLTPLAQDGVGTDGPLAPNRVGTGFTCDGKAFGNKSQTDGVTMDIAFSAVQARNNPNYTCDPEQRLATITVTKEIVNDNGGNNVVADYQLFIDDGVNTIPVTSGVPTVVPIGNYTVTETGIPGYQGSYTGPDCDVNGQVVLNQGDNKACTVVNDDIPPNITLFKNVTGTPPLASPTVFGLRIDGSIVPHNTSVPVTANAPHTINEDGRSGYSFVSITGDAECPAVLGGSVTLDEGEAIICTITNNKN